MKNSISSIIHLFIPFTLFFFIEMLLSLDRYPTNPQRPGSPPPGSQARMFMETDEEALRFGDTLEKAAMVMKERPWREDWMKALGGRFHQPMVRMEFFLGKDKMVKFHRRGLFCFVWSCFFSLIPTIFAF